MAQHLMLLVGYVLGVRNPDVLRLWYRRRERKLRLRSAWSQDE